MSAAWFIAIGLVVFALLAGGGEAAFGMAILASAAAYLYESYGH